MKVPRNLSAGGLIKALGTLGYIGTRKKGSHIRLLRRKADRSTCLREAFTDKVFGHSVNLAKGLSAEFRTSFQNVRSR